MLVELAKTHTGRGKREACWDIYRESFHYRRSEIGYIKYICPCQTHVIDSMWVRTFQIFVLSQLIINFII